MDEANVDRRTFLKLAGAGVAASALVVTALPAGAFGASGGAGGAERFLLRTAGRHVDADVLRYVSRSIGS